MSSVARQQRLRCSASFARKMLFYHRHGRCISAPKLRSNPSSTGRGAPSKNGSLEWFSLVLFFVLFCFSTLQIKVSRFACCAKEKQPLIGRRCWVLLRGEEGKTPATHNGDEQKVRLLGPAAGATHRVFLLLFKSLILFNLSKFVCFFSQLFARVDLLRRVTRDEIWKRCSVSISLFSPYSFFPFFFFFSYAATGKLLSNQLTSFSWLRLAELICQRPLEEKTQQGEVFGLRERRWC